MAASNKTQLTGIQSSDMGLVQAIADNFDANITSPNGLKSSHALALVMTQVCPNTEEGQEDTATKRLEKENVKDSTPSGIPISMMSYVGPVGVLMAGSGLEELMKAAFGGVMKMLTGKNFPQNTRALRIVVEQVLHQILCEVNTFDELMQELKARASKSRTARHWVENLILPVLLMLIFIRASEKETDPIFVGSK